MKVKVFSLAWNDAAAAFDDSAVERFLEDRTAVDLFEHFFVHERRPALVLVLTYREDAPKARDTARGEAGRGDSGRPDPCAGMSDEERGRFELLRRWRNDAARRSGKPPYLFLTNLQAAELSRKPPRTKAELREVHGIGESRIEAFGEELLGLLRATPGADGPAAPTGGASYGP